MSGEYEEIITQLIKFRNQHKWQKYHNLKDLALSLNLEASEVLEIFQWLPSDVKLDKAQKQHLEEEIADVLIYTFYMCDQLNVSPLDLVKKKMKFNQTRHWEIDD